MDNTFSILFKLLDKEVVVSVECGKNIECYLEQIKKITDFCIDSFAFINTKIKNINYETMVDVLETNPIINLVHRIR